MIYVLCEYAYNIYKSKRIWKTLTIQGVLKKLGTNDFIPWNLLDYIYYLTILISHKIKKINKKLYYKYDKNKEIILNYLFTI